MAFTFDPTTDRGKVRLLLHDTTDGTYDTDYAFSDADIDALLELNSDSIWYAAAEGCRILAVKAVATNYMFKIPGAIELDKRQIAKTYKALAKDYESRAGTSSDNLVEYIDSFDFDVSILGEDQSEYVGDV